MKKYLILLVIILNLNLFSQQVNKSTIVVNKDELSKLIHRIDSLEKINLMITYKLDSLKTNNLKQEIINSKFDNIFNNFWAMMGILSGFVVLFIVLFIGTNFWAVNQNYKKDIEDFKNDFINHKIEFDSIKKQLLSLANKTTNYFANLLIHENNSYLEKKDYFSYINSSLAQIYSQIEFILLSKNDNLKYEMINENILILKQQISVFKTNFNKMQSHLKVNENDNILIKFSIGIWDEILKVNELLLFNEIKELKIIKHDFENNEVIKSILNN